MKNKLISRFLKPEAISEFYKQHKPLLDFYVDSTYLGNYIEKLNNVTYEYLRDMSLELGGKLHITPLGDYTVTIPFDHHNDVDHIAKQYGMDTKTYLIKRLSEAIKKDKNLLKED